MKKTGRERMALSFGLMLLAALAGVLIASGARERSRVWDFGPWSAEAASAALDRYEADGSHEALAHALKGQCWRLRVQGDETAREAVRALGHQLLDRAKAGEVDLEAMDGDGTLLQALDAARQAGAR